jgi:hypothetical protein
MASHTLREKEKTADRDRDSKACQYLQPLPSALEHQGLHMFVRLDSMLLQATANCSVVHVTSPFSLALSLTPTSKRLKSQL